MTQRDCKGSFFLWGELTKPEVRNIAEKYGLVNASKKESMEICFIPNNDYAKFIANRVQDSDLIKA